MRLRTLRLILLVSLLFAGLGHAADAEDELRSLVNEFSADYPQLELPELELGYVENFKNIQNLDGIRKQQEFYKTYASRLRAIPYTQLSQESQYQHDALSFQFQLDLKRTALEEHYKMHEPSAIPAGGLHAMPRGADWYRYYVAKWAADLSPEALYQFGSSEVARVRREMRKLQKRLGYAGKDEAFFAHLNDKMFEIQDEAKLQQALLAFQEVIFTYLKKDFLKTDIPKVEVKPIPNPTKDSPPGYYEDGVFYYNFYQKRFPGRSLEWLFIHEAVPGHHYQGKTAEKPFPFHNLFWYPGFTEGWGAYAEDLGGDIGAYRDPYMAYGKWEWDLVRSARVVLDVGINYFGWSKAQALKYWHDNIPNQESIAEREVDRVLRWPCQVLAYKVGEHEILRLRHEHLRRGGSLRAFHTEVLRRGSIPLTLLRKVILNPAKSPLPE